MNKSVFNVFFLILSFSFLNSCSHAPKNVNPITGLAASNNKTREKLYDSESLILIYTNDLNGQTKDCGCPHYPRGGLEKRSTHIHPFLGKNNVLIIETGNSLFPSKNFSSNPLTEEEQTNTALQLLSFAEKHDYKAWNISPNELKFGVSKLQELSKKTSIPFINTNLISKKDNSKPFKEELNIVVKNKKVSIIGILNPMDAPSGYRGLSPLKTINSFLKSNSNKSDILVVMSALSETENIKLSKALKNQNTQIVILGSSSGSKFPLARKTESNVIIGDAASLYQRYGLLKLNLEASLSSKNQKSSVLNECGSDGSVKPPCHAYMDTY